MTGHEFMCFLAGLVGLLHELMARNESDAKLRPQNDKIGLLIDQLSEANWAVLESASSPRKIAAAALPYRESLTAAAFLALPLAEGKFKRHLEKFQRSPIAATTIENLPDAAQPVFDVVHLLQFCGELSALEQTSRSTPATI